VVAVIPIDRMSAKKKRIKFESAPRFSRISVFRDAAKRIMVYRLDIRAPCQVRGFSFTGAGLPQLSDIPRR
jgi:uncharacterized membrane protein